MKTLAEFSQSSKSWNPSSNLELGFEKTEDISDILIYDDHFYIISYKDGGYSLLLQNQEYIGTLSELEETLWDWAKYEMELHPDDIIADLAARLQLKKNAL